MMRIRIDGGRLTSEQLRRSRGRARRSGATSPTSPTGRTCSCIGSGSRTSPRSGTARSRRPHDAGGVRRHASRHPRLPARRHRRRRDPRRVPGRSGVTARFVGDAAFSNLPRKYKTSISGCAVRCTDPEINDISLAGVAGPGRPGFDLWVGGGLSTNPMFAQRLGAFVAPTARAEAWAAVTSLFREYGYRRSRNQSRLKFLVKDWGPGESARCSKGVPRSGRSPTGRPASRADGGSRPRGVPQRDGRIRRVRPAGRAIPATSCASSPTSPTVRGRRSAPPRSRSS